MFAVLSTTKSLVKFELVMTRHMPYNCYCPFVCNRKSNFCINTIIEASIFTNVLMIFFFMHFFFFVVVVVYLSNKNFSLLP